MQSINHVETVLRTTLGVRHISWIANASTGATNEVFQASVKTGKSNREDFVVKFYGGDHANKHAAAEVSACNLLRDSPVQVPTIFAHGMSSLPARNPYVVMSVIPGTPLETIIASVSQAERQQIAVQLAKVTAYIAQVRLPHYGALDQGHGNTFTNWFDCFRHRIIQALLECERQEIVDHRFIDRCIAMIDSQRANMSCSWLCPRLTHGDLVPKNIRVSHLPDEWRITGVFDFEHASGACPDWELAQIRRTMFERFPETEDVFLDTFECQMDIAPSRNWRTDIYKRIIPLYEVAEHIEFWEWGMQAQLADEVRSGVNYVAMLLADMENKK